MIKETLNKDVDLYPLRLSPIEYYFFKDDFPSHPMIFLRQLIFSGQIVRRAMEKALDLTTKRHPLFNSLVDNSSNGFPVWVPSNGRRPQIDWGDQNKPLKFPEKEYLDLTREVGLRLWVRQGPGRTTLTFQMHHACTDGMGSLAFFRDLFIAYSKQVNPKASLQFPTLKPDLLSRRSQLMGRNGEARRSQSLLSKLPKIFHFLMQQPTELSLPNPSKNGKTPKAFFPRIVSHEFRPEKLLELKAAAKCLGITLNDLMVRDLFLTIRNWNDSHFGKDSRKTIRILMPIDLRHGKMKEIPSTNLLSYGFLTQRQKDCGRDRKFLEKLLSQIGLFKNGGFSVVFLRGLEATQKIPAFYKIAKRGKGFQVSAVFSNLGDITNLLGEGLPLENGKIISGNLVLEGIRGCPPLRDKTHLAIHVMTYAGRMTVAATCTPEIFSLQDTREILMCFVSELEKSIQEFKQAQGT